MEKDSLKEKIVEAIKNSSERKFKQSVEVIFNFKNMNIEDADKKLNTNVFLPKGRGKDVKVGVFAEGDMNLRAKKLSKHVLNLKELQEYAKGKRKMRVLASKCYGFIAQMDLMPHVGKSWGVVLAPRGKMPQPIPGNADLEPVMKRIKNSVRLKSKKIPTVQAAIGTADMTPEDLAENGMAIYSEINKKIPKENIASIYVKTTMGKTVKVV